MDAQLGSIRFQNYYELASLKYSLHLQAWTELSF